MGAHARRRDGFALLAVLWVVVALGALALVARLAAHEMVAVAGNRLELARAGWVAEGCAERARAAIDRALRAAADEGPHGTTWPNLDRRVAASRLVGGCAVQLSAVGSRLDVNHAAAGILREVFLHAGARPTAADSAIAAVLDWRDGDERSRPGGAERSDYAAAGLRLPRNGPIVDVREIGLIRGITGIPGADSLLGVEPGRTSLNHAPAAVLEALPGMTPESVSRLLDMRNRGEVLTGLEDLEGRLSPGAREEMLRNFAALSGLSGTQPDGWILLSRASQGAPRVSRVIELKLVRVGTRAAVVRRRSWIE
jgi:type II secretory pathway component PulK